MSRVVVIRVIRVLGSGSVCVCCSGMSDFFVSGSGSGRGALKANQDLAWGGKDDV